MSVKLVIGQQVTIRTSDMASTLLAGLGWRRDGVYTGTLVKRSRDHRDRCCVEVDGVEHWFDTDRVTPC